MYKAFYIKVSGLPVTLARTKASPAKRDKLLWGRQ